MANCKYIKEQEIVSYNGGVDWQDVMPPQYRKGQLVEHDSEYCGEIDTIYRWRKLTGVYLCVDDMKYEKLILDESYDNGLSWYPAYPSEYTTGEAIGIDEEYCNDKFVGHYYMEVTQPSGTYKCPLNSYYWNGYKCVPIKRGSGGGTINPSGGLDPIKIIKCDGNPELTSADTKYYSSYPSNYKFYLFSAEIGKCVTSIAASAFTNSSALTYVYMADSVTSIGASAFKGCRSLSGMNTTVPGVLNIPSGVTSIGDYAFSGCSGITSIISNPAIPPTLGSGVFNGAGACPIYVPCGSYGLYQEAWPNRISCLLPLGGEVCAPIKVKYDYSGTSYTYYCGNDGAIRSRETTNVGVDRNTISGVSIGGCATSIDHYAFSGCTSLTSITIPDSVTSIGQNAFTNCNGLTSVNIPDSVTTIGWYAFEGCSSLTSCTIGSGVTSVGYRIFGGCTSLTSIVIPDSVTSIGAEMFLFCESLTSCTIGSGVTSIGNGAFSGCTSLTSIVIPDSVTDIGGYVFTNDRGLTSVTIGSGITSIGNSGFTNCSGLTEITINATTPPTLGNWPNASYVFANTNNCPIYVPLQSVETYKTNSQWSFFASRIQPIVLRRWVDDGFTCKYHDKWKQMKQQQSFDDGATWQDTGVVSATTLIEADSADCIPPGYLGFIATQSGSFSFTNSIYYSLDNGTTWNSLAANSSSPTINSGDVIFWKSTPYSTGSGVGTFSSTASFKAVGNPMSLWFGDNFSGQTSLAGKDYAFGYLFEDCGGLTNIDDLVLPATTLANACYRDMFKNCRNLTTIPSDLLPATTLQQSCYRQMFYGCSSLTTAPVLSATTLTTSCYRQMFYGCSSLSEITCLATALGSYSTDDWMNGVANNGTFTKSATMTNWSTGVSGIPSGWTVQDAQ